MRASLTVSRDIGEPLAILGERRLAGLGGAFSGVAI